MFNFVRRDPGHTAAENLLTPLEIAARRGTPAGDDFLISDHLRSHPPKRFRRRRLGEGVTLFSADAGASRLLVVFCGKAHRPMVPISALLQMLDDEAFDVLMLDDARRRHFENGVDGFAGSLLELVDRIERLAGRRGMTAIVTLGTSMGGFPALRAGRLLRAERAVSVGGRFAWHIQRLLNGRNAIPAFDVLCSCAPGSSRCFNVYATDNAADADAAAQLARMTPDTTSLALPGADHNVLKAFFKIGRLDEFCRAMLDPDRAPDEAGLAATLIGAPTLRSRKARRRVDV